MSENHHNLAHRREAESDTWTGPRLHERHGSGEPDSSAGDNWSECCHKWWWRGKRRVLLTPLPPCLTNGHGCQSLSCCSTTHFVDVNFQIVFILFCLWLIYLLLCFSEVLFPESASILDEWFKRKENKSQIYTLWDRNTWMYRINISARQLNSWLILKAILSKLALPVTREMGFSLLEKKCGHTCEFLLEIRKVSL